jgi:CRISPR-associated protein Cas1
MKRVLEISREPAHLSVRNKQLILKREGQTIGQVPCEDIGVVLVDHPQTTYSHAALMELAASDAAVVICGRDHLPAAMLLPMIEHSQVVWRLNAQLSISQPLRKQLWKQLVIAKIRAQAANLPREQPAYRKLLALARDVRSGDPKNVEAQAARVYWNNWLHQEEFRRNPDGTGLNVFLNYGYAVVRAGLARAIVAAGLLPSIGLHHCNRGNPFCLADDLIEPLRPVVDDRVRDLRRQGYDQLNQPAKAALLEVLADHVMIDGEAGPLMTQIHRYVASLVRCFNSQANRLEIPVMIQINSKGV